MQSSLETTVAPALKDGGPVATPLPGRAKRRGRCLVLSARPGRCPTIRINGLTKSAHRVSYETFVGPIPAGAWVLHSCIGQRNCIAPELRPSSPPENAADAVRAGRSTRGTRNPNAKMTPSLVREARGAARRGRTLTDVAGTAGVSRQAVRLAVHHQTWGWLR